MNPTPSRPRFKAKELALLAAPLLLIPVVIFVLKSRNEAEPQLVGPGRPPGRPLSAGGNSAASQTKYVTTDRSIWELEFSPDGGTLAAADLAGRVQWFDPKTGKLKKKLVVPHIQRDMNGRIYQPDPKTEKLKRKLPVFGVQQDSLKGMAYAGNGRVLAVNLSNFVVLFDGRSGKFLRTLDEPRRPELEAEIERARRFIAKHRPTPEPPLESPVARGKNGAGKPGNTARPRPTQNPELQKASLTLLRRRVLNAVAVSPDGKIVAAGAAPWWSFGPPIVKEAAVCLWSAQTGRLLASLPTTLIQIDALEFSPDGRWLAVQSWNATGQLGIGVVQLWNLATRRKQWETEVKGVAEEIRFSPDGQWVVAAGDSPLVLRAKSGEKEIQMELGDNNSRAGATKLSFAAGGEMLLGCHRHGPLSAWNLGDGNIATVDASKTTAFGASVMAFALSPDEKRLALVNGSGKVEIWDASGLKGDVAAKPSPLAKPKRLLTLNIPQTDWEKRVQKHFGDNPNAAPLIVPLDAPPMRTLTQR